MAAIGRDIPQQVRRGVAVRHNDVEAAVVIDIAEGGSATGGDERLHGAAARGDFLEAAARDAAKEQIRLGIRIRRERLGLESDPPVGFVEIDQSVVIEVE